MLLQLYDAPLEVHELDCVEIYMPKRLQHLAELYAFLRALITDRLEAIVLDGFSVYEVDGVFQGREKLWEERSLVIRILSPRPARTPKALVQGKMKDLGRGIATRVAPNEEEIWICHYPQTVLVFRPRTKLIA
jgi:hypothetical protein